MMSRPDVTSTAGTRSTMAPSARISAMDPCSPMTNGAIRSSIADGARVATTTPTKSPAPDEMRLESPIPGASAPLSDGFDR